MAQITGDQLIAAGRRARRATAVVDRYSDVSMDATTETLQHDAAVEELRSSYAALPPGQPVRLTKQTSNLFRPRTRESVTGLDVSNFADVIDIDVEARTADVQGMCTYERLVDATLRHGLVPLVVPQLKTITLGGAVSGLGIESSSFRNGLPHESVLEIDVLTGDGRVLTASPDGPYADLFAAFPNSYGSLGYALRLRIELEPVHPYVALRHVGFSDLDELTGAVTAICRDRRWAGEAVDFLDGVAFSPREAYLTMGRWSDDVHGAGLLSPSDYTGQQIYYRSIRERSRDVLTVEDYLWRWDTDWFWCSSAFGAQHRVLRRLWPTRLRRSDVYHRIVGLEHRFDLMRRLNRIRQRPLQERVVQDVEIPVSRTADFVEWFLREVPIEPVWLCPVRLRDSGTTAAFAAQYDGLPWPLYPLRTGETYVNVGFWSTVAIAGGARDGDVNRRIEAVVAEHDGHKSLYSDVYYDEQYFWTLYGGDDYRVVKRRYDPEGRLADLYAKAVRRK